MEHQLLLTLITVKKYFRLNLKRHSYLAAKLIQVTILSNVAHGELLLSLFVLYNFVQKSNNILMN